MTGQDRRNRVLQRYRAIVDRPNQVDENWDGGWFERFRYPVVTRDHIPPTWRYDFDPERNPMFLERLAVNAVCNPGAMEWQGKVVLMCRVEGSDRKSFFAVAESENGVDGFRFWDEPALVPDAEDPATNEYDMRLVPHEDGWVYGLFCAERLDPDAAPGDLSSAVAQCGIARTRDLKSWERLPDLQTDSAQQRNVVLHPEFVDGKYLLYTRPQDSFIDAGSGGGIGYGLADSMEHAAVAEQHILDPRVYHTIKEVKNGQGPAPLKTRDGWLHIAHGVRNTAAGLRYVLYLLLCDLDDPRRVVRRPGGFLIGPVGAERVGDVSNVAFCNGAVKRENGEILIYYASADTRIHVARTTEDRLLDYVHNTPEDALRSHPCTRQRLDLIRRNREWAEAAGDDEVLAFWSRQS